MAPLLTELLGCEPNLTESNNVLCPPPRWVNSYRAVSPSYPPVVLMLSCRVVLSCRRTARGGRPCDLSRPLSRRSPCVT